MSIVFGSGRKRAGYSSRHTGEYIAASKSTALRYLLLPYGEWRCADGRWVLFNRRYHPIWQFDGDSLPTRADHTEWVERIVSKRYFYDDQTPEPERRRAGLTALESWGLPAPDRSDLVRGRIAEVRKPPLHLPAWRVWKQVTVWCAHCRAFHFHGGEPGHRIAHCFSSEPPSPYLATGYVLHDAGPATDEILADVARVRRGNRFTRRKPEAERWQVNPAGQVVPIQRGATS